MLFDYCKGVNSAMKSTLLLLLVSMMILAGCQPVQRFAAANDTVEPTPTASTPEAVTLELEGFIQRTHDPVIAHEDDTYYVFSTGARIPFLCSPDMLTWEFCGRIFEQIPAWTRDVNPQLGDIWAPDISFFNNRWHLYYAVSTFGTQDSAIGLATNATLDPASPDYAWQDHGIVLRSQPGDRWNAIDPNFVVDADGESLAAFGSYWSGLKLIQLDPATGKFPPPTRRSTPSPSAPPDNPPSKRRSSSTATGTTISLPPSTSAVRARAAPTTCASGAPKRSPGRIVDRDGVPMLEGGGTLILQAYDRWRGPGHNGMLSGRRHRLDRLSRLRRQTRRHLQTAHRVAGVG
jgi:arabinan endo-1,5-alpha-L-arabinosidase